ncbi:LacI family DNA-binding transcriptional regulator [Cellulomonas fimi]|uniref:Transcriptional regulator, LacI family n=1 Tax=Cellulomonas fimi (strain ATCC 484 / DSM 20113 / JCM 1341 / CCUG 24087 / LMG 16345 / NBRC 15513 / NCIMB 8980 / NCTC 7547 / NRS-133) TaxID=590998 RepID=F4GYJ0_CELFA|nr:LacI family DNA-binding transcriptional regulator [Cellulomonas fimi]AEE47107.1 transcriptional regulator, LacI family [Cellulomonas fimi ATCC 484]NNH07322.1 LacI family transcriptional regulator [Cellulomonas fimi]
MTSPARRRPSVADVARAAGVSVGSVSNVLNRPDTVLPETRERVEEAIRSLSFVRNGPARQLRRGTITTVGAIVLDIRNPFFTDVARGIEDRLALDDHTLMLASSDDDPERESKYLRMFEEHGVLGLLVVPTSSAHEHLVEIQERGVPVVLLDAPSSTTDMPSVSVDDVAGGTLAMAHLLSLGHHSVVFLNGPHTIRQCQARRTGVDRAVEAAGLAPDRVVDEVTLTTMDASGGDAALAAWIARHGGRAPDAVFCVNDLVAIGVQRRLRRHGGSELLARTAIVGYDDIDVAAELAQPLTSVRQPTHEMGYAAANVLLHGAERSDAEHIVFQPELVVRASTVQDPAASSTRP